MNRRNLLTIILVIVCWRAYAYEPIYDDGKVWIRTITDSRMGYAFMQEYHEVVGDTVIAGKTVKKIECYGVPADANPTANFEYNQGIYGVSQPYKVLYYRYENDGKVYDCQSDGSMRLLIDFSSPVGTRYTYVSKLQNTNVDTECHYTIVASDTVRIGYYDYHRVTVLEQAPSRIELALAEQRPMDYIYRPDNWSERYLTWLEGVGVLNEDHFLNAYTHSYSQRTELKFCMFPTVNRYVSRANFTSLPKAAISSVEADPQYPADGKIYDLEGRAVEHPVAGHIYIRNGRKIVWRD